MSSQWLDRSVCLIPLPAAFCLGWLLLSGQTEMVYRPGLDWIYLDPIALTFMLFIAVLGVLVYDFSRRNLKGDVRRGRFLLSLGGTLWAVQGLATSGNYALFFCCWLAMGFGLTSLLQHYRHRPGAVIVAKERILINWLGDLALIAAGSLMFLRFHNGNFAQLPQILAHQPQENVFSIAALLMIGALTKSAQVPFHAWLPRTLEAPTPVSALMHAGIINAGGYLLIRTYSLVSHSELTLSALLICGLISTLWGVLAMQMQSDVKRRLAWSTVGQMGFMMVEIGAGLPTVALLHLMGHGFYKAHSFLSSSTRPPLKYLRKAPSLSLSLASVGLWAGLSAGGLALVARFAHTHLLVALLVAVLLLPLIYLALLQARFSGLIQRLMIAVAVGVGSFWLGLYSPAWFGLPEALPTGGLREAVLIFVIFTFLLLSLLVVFQPWCQSFRWYRQLYASGLHGFGFGRWPEAFADRFFPKGEAHL